MCVFLCGNFHLGLLLLWTERSGCHDIFCVQFSKTLLLSALGCPKNNNKKIQKSCDWPLTELVPTGQLSNLEFLTFMVNLKVVPYNILTLSHTKCLNIFCIHSSKFKTRNSAQAMDSGKGSFPSPWYTNVNLLNMKYLSIYHSIDHSIYRFIDYSVYCSFCL